jgi:hypothetical protein
MADRLNPGDDLAGIGSITSQNGQSTLVMQGDGNLVLYRSGGIARWATATDGRVVSQAVMQGDGNFVMYGPGGTYIWDTATDGHPGAWLIVQDDGNVVIYDSAGYPLWATNTMIVSQSVSGFLPSTSGFHFSNSNFPSVPDLTINVLGQQIAIGDASQGLCGGMVFAARDYFDAGMAIPSDMTNPSSGPLFDHIVKRLFDSFNLLLPLPPLPPVPGLFITPTPPFGPGPYTYLHLMNPDVPDHETVASKIGFSFRGRAWIMIHDEWPKIKADIDSGQLSPIALVLVKDHDPTKMGGNHQVLVYGYSLDGTDLTMRLYDPNSPDEDTVTMSLSIADPEHTVSVMNSAASPVWCFFRPIYTFSSPPPPPPPPPAVGIGDHFYTTSAAERDSAIANFGYSSEGMACYVFDTPTPGTVPLYRLLHSSNGDHFYTTSAGERDNAIATFGYIPEGTACYVFDTQTPGTVPLYRLLKTG